MKQNYISIQTKRTTHSLASNNQAKVFQTHIQLCTALALALSAALCGCGTARISNRQQIGSAPTAKPAIIFVADFDLEAARIQSEKGILALPLKPPGFMGEMMPPLPGTAKDPKEVARTVVNTMSESLVKDLIKAGLNARRLALNENLPASGWLVRGVFTEVNQGNQLQRAVIGFGLGKTDLQVLVDIKDLSQGPPKLFYELHTAADSGKAPGSGPTIILGPAGVAARYVIAGQDLNRNVKQTAAKIAAELADRTREPGTAAPGRSAGIGRAALDKSRLPGGSAGAQRKQTTRLELRSESAIQG